MPSVLVTANDVTRGKPDPEAYLLAAARLGVRSNRCVVIEDAPAGIRAAHAAGMRVIAVATTHSPAELGEADVRVERLTDIHISRSGVPHGSRLALRVKAGTDE